MPLYRCMNRNLDAYSIDFDWWPDAERWYEEQKRYIESDTSSIYGNVMVEMRSVVCGFSLSVGVDVSHCFRNPMYVGYKGSVKKSIRWLWFELELELRFREVPFKVVGDFVGDWSGKFVREIRK